MRMMTTQTLKLKLKDEAELFSSFDPDQEQLSEDVASYLVRSFHQLHKNNREQYILQLQFDTPVDKERIIHKCKTHFLRRRDEIRRVLRKLTQKAICLGIFGVIILSIWFYLSAKSESVNLEILSIIGWVSIWEATSMILIGSHEARETFRNFNKIVNAEIVILE